METAYRPAAAEAYWRRRWEELHLGAADPRSPKPPFSVACPPPNITGVLHMGHALNLVVQDSLCRYQRMRGYEVCWLPGTDHAAIATQNVIERQLAAEGTSKEELGRPAFQLRVDEWYLTYQGRILEQMRGLGASCDFARERFTMDPEYVRVIRTVFGELFRQGLIYRGPRIVNWCPRCRSAISDEEVDYQEDEGTFYVVRYPLVEGAGAIEVATTRPETILADVAVAVAPQDPRYRELVGRRVREPLTGREIPVIEDQAVDPALGTGALKVTPGHSADDYEVGQRHGLEILTVISLEGRMVAPGVPELDSLPVAEARPAAAQLLSQRGLLVREEPIRHQVGHCDRCGTVIEPLVTPQWWLRMEELARPAAAAVEQGQLRLHPPQYRVQYLAWIEGLHDWCISRQLWLGHSIPVSRCANGHTFAWVDPPTVCPECQNQELSHDPDVLDTWFSSALWPFAILGWPDSNAALERFYPTAILSTARDILALWVARMVIMGLRFTGEVPFRDVLFHATILGSDGARMAKSRGNVVDPLELAQQHGADALRAWGASVAMGTQDCRFDETKIEGFARFANKLWNMVRLLQRAQPEGPEAKIPELAAPAAAELELADRWVLSRLQEVTAKATAAFEEFDLGAVINGLYEFTWHEVADWYLELAKPRLEGGSAAALWTTRQVLWQLLQLIHPVMPFVTDSLAEQFKDAPATLDFGTWPEPDPTRRDQAAEAAMSGCRELISGLRQWLQSLGIQSGRGGDGVAFFVERAGPELVAPEARGYVSALAGIRWAEVTAPGVPLVLGRTSLRLVADDIASDRWRQAVGRRLEEVEAQLQRLEGRLASAFVTQAPAPVVASARERLRELQQRRDLLRGVLDS
ncbi:MAG: valine--tRNA ligase [Candidatus Dormibacteria bacterium]